MKYTSPRFKQIASTGILLLTAFIWGMCFVAQRSSMEHIGPFLFNGIRAVLASVILALIAGGMLLTKRKQANEHKMPLRNLVIAGVICGLALFCASSLQQIGLVTVSASKSAFITTLYIVLVPILGLFLKQRTHWNTWLSVGIAVVGLYLLCVGTRLVLETADSILIASALFWTLHILAVGHFAPRLSLRQLFCLCALQFGVTGVLSLGAAPLFDAFYTSSPVSLDAILAVAPEILYAGVLSTAVGFTLAAVAQRYAKPTPAAIVMSTESVFGLLGGLVLLGESLTPGEWVGCVLMLIAVILTQLEFGKRAPANAKDAETNSA